MAALISVSAALVVIRRASSTSFFVGPFGKLKGEQFNHFAQLVYLARLEAAPSPGTQTLYLQGSIYGTHQLDHIYSNGFHHTAHNAVAPFVHVQNNGIGLCRMACHPIGFGRAVVQIHPKPQLKKLLIGEQSAGLHLVYLAHLVTGMHQAVGEVSVVGKQNEAGSVAVESTNGIQAQSGGIFDEVHDCLAPLFVAGGCDSIAGFVHKQVDERFELNLLSIYLNTVVG